MRKASPIPMRTDILSTVKAGETVTLVFSLDDAYDDGNIKLIAAEHSMDDFYQVFDMLKEQRWMLDEVSSARLSGTITVKQDGVMFTSIPYDEGWSVKVDGETVRPEKIADAFIGISLTKGEHQIEMRYCPKGFAVGLLLTCVSGMLFVGIYVLGKRLKKH